MPGDAAGRLELSLAEEGDLRLWRMLLYTEGADPTVGRSYSSKDLVFLKRSGGL